VTDISLDLGLPAPSGDGRVRRCLVHGLDDVPDAGPGRAGDDVQFLGRNGRAHEHNGGDTRHRLVDAGWHAQVAHGDLSSKVSLRLGPVRISHQHQHPHGHFSLSAKTPCLGADLAGRRYEYHPRVSSVR
jgi:hypothetical protein